MNNTAQPTFYDGINFKSKNEAKWSLFFHKCNIEREYEPQRFVGWNRTTYAPDFYLPEYGIYVETKGSDEHLHTEDMERKLEGAIDYESTPVSNGLLLLGAFPFDVRIVDGLYFETDFLYWHKGVVSGTAFIYENVYGNIDIELIRNCKDAGCPIPRDASCVIRTHQQRDYRATKLYEIVREVNKFNFNKEVVGYGNI